jgi:hypothetical protein
MRGRFQLCAYKWKEKNCPAQYSSNLQQNDKTYFALGSPEQDFPGLKNEAFNTHAEDNASNAGYVLVPFAVVTDIVIGVVVLVGFFLCALLGGDCLP